MTDAEAKQRIADQIESVLRKHEQDSARGFADILHETVKAMTKHEGTCAACGQKNRWPSSAKDVRCGRCGLPMGT